jgi:hypothetical protein
MNIERKTYETPRVTVNGTVEQLTLTGGGASVDVPQGTSAVGGINSITGS